MDEWKPDERVIKELEDALTQVEDPDEPIAADSERTYSSREILEEVKQGTPIGREYHQGYLILLKEE